jgi:beta-lysine 5,6-aminomutase alpha subunit
MPHLKLDQALVDEARALAKHIVEPVIAYIGAHTTVAIERATLRLIGVDGIDEEGVPLPNRVVDSALGALGALGALAPLPGGILRPFVSAMLRSKLHVQATAEAIGRNEIALHELPDENDVLATIDAEARRLVKEGVTRIRARRSERTAMIEALSNPPTPWLYVIVATGNIYEDIIQAQAAGQENHKGIFCP